MSLSLPDNYPELYSHIAHVVYDMMVGLQLPSDVANEIALATSESVRLNLGGGQIYLEKGVSYENAARNKELWDRFNGDNYKELAALSGLCVMRIRQIINEMRIKERERRQPNLF
ncbi:hypothetical protein AZSI13_32670 [Azospira sp. I13]|uniref:Mor transcription activator family protein n=1 Tax=Azospira sp. I13 TaxID=1765050 RepID=UPI000D4A0C20|nr:Mor transcription activator family protein [Azospira sp. I13]GBG03940.1 hypothetical protein AZSI13_32670 [Azospira sp. I13]